MSYHDAHLTKLASAALNLPGTFLWSLVLKLGLATRPCTDNTCCGN